MKARLNGTNITITLEMLQDAAALITGEGLDCNIDFNGNGMIAEFVEQIGKLEQKVNELEAIIHVAYKVTDGYYEFEDYPAAIEETVDYLDDLIASYYTKHDPDRVRGGLPL